MTHSRETGRRFGALDGLRGLAAIVVVFGHLANAAWPAFSDIGRPGAAVPAFPQATWWVHSSPVELLVAGHEAVIVFFVLSGFVLALPLTGGGRFDALGYYPRRVLRLYLPVWAAVAIAVLLHAAVTRHATPGESWWLAGHAEPLSARATFDALSLKLPEQFSVFTALWSLRWEMVFSVLLPLYAWVAIRGRRLPLLLVLVPLVPICLAGERAPMQYLPCFFLGTALATRMDLAAAAGVRLRASAPWRVAARTAAVLALTAQAWLGDGTLSVRLGAGLTALGAVAVTVLALEDPAVRRLLQRRPAHWLGSRSFSVYLVHEPLLVTIAFLLHRHLTLWLLVPLALPVIAAASELFYRAVERPAHTLSRRVGRSLGRPRQAAAAPATGYAGPAAPAPSRA